MTATITRKTKTEQLRVTPLSTTPGARSWKVENLDKGSSYTVEESAGGYTCTCKAWEYSKTCTCKHGEAIEWEQVPQLAPVASLTEYRQQKQGNQAVDVEVLPDGVDPLCSKYFPDANILQGIELTWQQRQAVARIIDWFFDSNEPFFLLQGYAGTGKTTVLQAVLTILQKLKNPKTVISAPTHKAVKVNKKMLNRWGLQIEASTVCSLLGLRPKIDFKTGKQYFAPDPTTERSIDTYDLVAVDEGSMLGKGDPRKEETKGLYLHLKEAIEVTLFRTQKVLLIGDDAQLLPINEAVSPVFVDEEIQDEHKVCLTEVIRYGSSIGAMATEIRGNLEKRGDFYYQDDHSDDQTKGIWDCELDRWQSFIERAFTSATYQDDPDACRVLAYTNKRVAFLNDIVRKAIYGELAAVEPYIQGERLIANEPCMSGKTILLQNSSECELISAQKSQTETRFSVKGYWQIWRLHVLTDEGKYRALTVLHDDDRKEFEAELKKLARAKKWNQFWDLKQSMHNVGYAYALTVHKSQGSTFKDVFIDIENISTNRKPAERNRLQYTALTRASHRAFIYQ